MRKKYSYRKRKSNRRNILKSHNKNKKQKVTFEEIIAFFTAVVLIISFVVLVHKSFTDEKEKVQINEEYIASFGIPIENLYKLKELSEKYSILFDEIIAVYSIYYDFFPDKNNLPSSSDIEQTFIINYDNIKNTYREADIEKFTEIFTIIFEEVEKFPIMTGYIRESQSTYVYSDSYGTPREYGGDRIHEGTDIVDRENVDGRIPIASMTNGVVENIGWNELGGYRVGVRSSNGTYYYYAHLDSFASNIEKGSDVLAGDLLGFMGSTGYSKSEGTNGNFPVHLHLGIAVDIDFLGDEFWINPYPFLRLIESETVQYTTE